jgi:RNA polymerase sigma-70 factor (ECF subfamily)
VTEHIDFPHIYEKFYQKILHYLTRMVGANEAEDAAQVVFDKISRHLGNFKSESKVSTWVYRIATNTAMDMLKSSSYKRSSTGSLAPLPVEFLEAGEGVAAQAGIHHRVPDQQLIRHEMNECIREFVDNLPPDYRTVIILNELEGFTNKEIAAVLQVSVDTAKVRLHRARARLKKMLEQGCEFYHDDRSELACDRKQPDNNC